MSVATGWPCDWPGPDLNSDEVHVAGLSVGESGGLLPLLQEVLDPAERSRAAAFHFASDRDEYIAARGALKVLLARYVGLEPGEIRLEPDRFGKPLLVGGSDVQFNVSHSGSLVVIAFAKERAVGVDVEMIRPDVPYLDLAQRFFSPAELLQLRSRPPESQRYHFFATWVHKEAYMKGLGEGFSIESNRFSVSIDDDRARPVDDPFANSGSLHWQTQGIDVADGFVGAVAVERTGWRIEKFDARAVLESDAAPRGPFS